MCSLRFENNLLTIEGVRFASISKKTPLSKLSFAFVSLALPLLLTTLISARSISLDSVFTGVHKSEFFTEKFCICNVTCEINNDQVAVQTRFYLASVLPLRFPQDILAKTQIQFF